MNKLDSSIDDMENTRFMTLYGSLIKEFAHATNFTQDETASILMLYHKFVLVNGPQAKMMTKKQIYNMFLVMFQIYDSQVIDRILLNITDDVKFIDATAWVNLFKVFMSEDLKLRMKFAFDVYNFKGTGLLNREVVQMAVDKFFTGDDEDEVNELRADMVEFLFNKFDIDKDGVISFEEYEGIVSKQPCLLEFLGQVFPSRTEKEVIAYCANIISYIFNNKDNTI